MRRDEDVEFRVTLTGTPVRVYEHQDPKQLPDCEVRWAAVQMEGDTPRGIQVNLLETGATAQLLSQRFDREWDSLTADAIVVVAILEEIDRDPAFIAETGTTLDVGPEEVLAFFTRPRQSNTVLRRYIARRVYDAMGRGTLLDRNRV